MLHIVLLSMVLASPASDGTFDAQKALAASSGWVKAPAAGETTTVAFVTVDNPTMYDVYLVSAATAAAGKVEFRRVSKTDAKAEAVTAITAPAYGSVAMTSDGVYLLLSDLKRPLKAGDKVTLTLTTDSGISVSVDADVKPD